MYPLLQDPQARCNVSLLLVYVQVYSLVWACLCLKFYWMFYLEIKSTLVVLWSIFIPLKISNAMNNIYQLVLISCAKLSLSSWLLIPLTTISKSEKFRFSKRVWPQGFRIRDCVPVACIVSVRHDSVGTVEWAYVSVERRPLTGPLAILMCYMSEYGSPVEWYWQVETEGLEPRLAAYWRRRSYRNHLHTDIFAFTSDP
jgi:hypothetical protein